MSPRRDVSPAVVSRRRWMELGLAGLGTGVLCGSRVRGAGPARDEAKSTIYVAATSNALNEDGARTNSLLAIDPETGNWSAVLNDCDMRPRVSPDGRMVAFGRRGAVWVGELDGAAEPKKVLDLEGATAGSPAVWSPDSRQLITSLGTMDADDGPWEFRTIRVNADGTGRADVPIPQEDGVQDWSSDGQWLLTSSSRNAEIGWQLYVMRTDGSEPRQITEGGNPFYARFSPDGRRVVYADGTTEERRGIWEVGADGKERRKLFATGKDVIAGPCYSPDGSRVAVSLREYRVNGCRVDVMDLRGGRSLTVALPDTVWDMPDWR